MAEFRSRWQQLRDDADDLVGPPIGAVLAEFGTPDDKMRVEGRWVWASWKLTDGEARVVFGGTFGTRAVGATAQTHAEAAAKEAERAKRLEAQAAAQVEWRAQKERDRLEREQQAKEEAEAKRVRAAARKAEREADRAADRKRAEALETRRREAEAARRAAEIERQRKREEAEQAAKRGILGSWRASSQSVDWLTYRLKNASTRVRHDALHYVLTFAEDGTMQATLVAAGKVVGAGRGTWTCTGAVSPPSADFEVKIAQASSSVGVPPRGTFRMRTGSATELSGPLFGHGKSTAYFKRIDRARADSILAAAHRPASTPAPSPGAQVGTKPDSAPADEAASIPVEGIYVLSEAGAAVMKGKIGRSVTYKLTLKRGGAFETYYKASGKKPVRTKGTWARSGRTITLSATHSNGRRMRNPKSRRVAWTPGRIDMDGIELTRK
ncbi:MAG: hypothetical protein P1V36_13815 [Planctomycetota bacterium]|nr:hypothetical protein [Planctomycetota bacterium]